MDITDAGRDTDGVFRLVHPGFDGLGLFGLLLSIWLTNRHVFMVLHQPAIEFLLVGSLGIGLAVLFYIGNLWTYYYLANWLK